MALVITGSDTYQDGSNTTSTNIDFTLPSYSSGDLVIICYDLWANSGSPTVTWANGPNGETVTNVVNSFGDSGAGGVRIAIGYYIATAGYVGGDMANDSTVSTRWAGAVIIVPSGEYDPDTPISSAVSSDNSAADVTDLDMPAFSANANDGGGKLLVFCASDQDPWNATMPSGYTALEQLDQGRAAITLAGRDSAVTNSESIAAANFDLSGSNTDAIAIYAFIVREVPQATTYTKDSSVKANLDYAPEIYSRGDETSLPSGTSDLETVYSASEVTDVSSDDGTRVAFDGAGFVLHLYKYRHSNDTDQIEVTWNGQTNNPPSVSTVYLQIYNFNSTSWETLDSDSSTAVDTDFDLTGTKTSSLTNYYDANNYVYVRVYQENTN